KRISASHEVELIGFAGDRKDAKPDALDKLFKKEEEKPPAPAPAEEKKDENKEEKREEKKGENEGIAAAGKAPPHRDVTDLNVALAWALDRAGQGQGKVLGVVVLTDGQHNAGQGAGSPVARATLLHRHRVPLYLVGLGARKAPPDVAVLE